MADRPILFSAPMVRALLAGRKTQTRRLCKDQPPPGVAIIRKTIRPFGGEPYHAFERRTKFGNFGGEVPVKISRGDRLWVRETWQGLSFGDYQPTKSSLCEVRYAATDPCADLDGEARGYPWRPSIFMPRWASRLTVIVTDVRVERLQDISIADALAEGWPGAVEANKMPATKWYRHLWDEINGAGAWEANPWVAAYTFTVIKQNIDQIEKVAA
ncbi:hypothetical protein I7F13_27480 [Sinorhizobium meliloti]|uniref:hypothetical protein n=1 Tax=Rhizobium meliloti TaxID=382 RepID=UPI000B49F772|nr:hypothetical protein [Sinorhizobium meliloti]ASP84276.1 hypothetical protein CDO26_06435 [Sinorhizobium meliloti]MDE3825895.1 hypothetical protein [Sinorhizobium meliloti]RVG90405.1 hypothetical protein CN218_23730 [Sinorhizobium meliloti]RVM43453.1 hypothetical protein CN127_25985 [Sinorhizobium meliloti]RVN67594.1 hypothetical protein CN106_16275 [Sinorhizobium meliloti]